MTILEPMPPERFDEFVDVVSASHAADSVASGRWLEQESGSLARAELGRLLPQQAATPDHRFYEIKSDLPLSGVRRHQSQHAQAAGTPSTARQLNAWHAEAGEAGGTNCSRFASVNR